MPTKLQHLHASHRCNISAGLFGFRDSMIRQKYPLIIHQGEWDLGYVFKVQTLKLYPNFPVYWGGCLSFNWYWVAWNTTHMRQMLAPVLWLPISLCCFSRWFIMTAIYHSDRCCLLIAFCFITVLSSPPVACFCVLGICQEHSCTI